MQYLIRPELPSDLEAIRRINAAAFGRDAESQLVDELRRSNSLALSLVAIVDGEIVGHVAFSPVSIEQAPAGFRAIGLAPVAVLPEHQRRGIAAALIRSGLAEITVMGFHGVVVLGDPAYYSRFGFIPASQFKLRCEYDVPPEAFMALSFDEPGFADCSGLIRYDPAFANV